MKIEIEVTEGQALENARQATFLYAIEKHNGDPRMCCYFLGISMVAFVSNCAKYNFTSMIKKPKMGAPIKYQRHAYVLRMRDQGYSFETIAKDMGITTHRVKGILKRMIKEIQK